MYIEYLPEKVGKKCSACFVRPEKLHLKKHYFP